MNAQNESDSDESSQNDWRNNSSVSSTDESISSDSKGHNSSQSSLDFNTNNRIRNRRDLYPATFRQEMIEQYVKVDGWSWDQEHGHKLFNWHNGYQVIKTLDPIIGSAVVYENPSQAIEVKQPRNMTHSYKKEMKYQSIQKKHWKSYMPQRLLNIVYDRGVYYIYQPNKRNQATISKDPLKQNNPNPEEDSQTPQHFEIKDTLWKVIKFQKDKNVSLKLGNVIRFGRVCFKITDIKVPAPTAANKNQANKKNKDQKKKGIQPVQYGIDQWDIDQSLNASIMGSSSNQMSLDFSGANANSILLNGIDINNPLNQDKSNNNENAFSIFKAQKRLSLAQMLERKRIEADGRSCRICLDDDETPENPFVRACHCTGSCKYIHLQCLRDWLNSKRVKKKSESSHTNPNGGNVTFYCWPNLECEICKFLYREQVEVAGSMVQLLEYDLPGQETQVPESDSSRQPQPKPDDKDLCYMVIQSEIPGKTRMIFVIDFQTSPLIQIGRRNTNQISIQDISVSRDHSILYYNADENQILLSDNDSKFGTFISIDGLLAIPNISNGQQSSEQNSSQEQQSVLAVQSDRKCLFVSLVQRFTGFQKFMFGCCLGLKTIQEKRMKLDLPYDHFIDYVNKFPPEIRQVLYPQSPRALNKALLRGESANSKTHKQIKSRLLALEQSILEADLPESINLPQRPTDLTGSTAAMTTQTAQNKPFDNRSRSVRNDSLNDRSQIQNSNNSNNSSSEYESSSEEEAESQQNNNNDQEQRDSLEDVGTIELPQQSSEEEKQNSVQIQDDDEMVRPMGGLSNTAPTRNKRRQIVLSHPQNGLRRQPAIHSPQIQIQIPTENPDLQNFVPLNTVEAGQGDVWDDDTSLQNHRGSKKEVQSGLFRAPVVMEEARFQEWSPV